MPQHADRPGEMVRHKRNEAPWWWPDQRGSVILGLFILTAGILWWSRPINGAEPSEFFKAIAQAVVLTGFLTAVGFLFQSSKGASEANARADAALDVAKATTAATTDLK